MGYKKLTAWLEVSWGMNNTLHGDDQLLVVNQGDVVALVIADGVSTATGRWASALLCYHIGQGFDEQSQNLVRQHLEDVEQFMKVVVLEAVKKTRAEVAAFSQYAMLSKSPAKDVSKRWLESVAERLRKFGEYLRTLYTWHGTNPDEDKSIKLLNFALKAIESLEENLTIPANYSDKRLKELVERLPKGIGETDERVIERLRESLFKESSQDWDSTTTLCFVIGRPILYQA